MDTRNCPSDIFSQINEVVEIRKKHPGGELVGIYLHGSISLNAFQTDAEVYVVYREFPDTDVTSYIRLINQYGY